MPPDVGFLTRRAITVRRPPRGAAFLRLKGKACWLCGDFSACWCVSAGKSVFEVVVSLRVCAWSLDPSWWAGRLFAPAVSTVPGHRARPLAALPAAPRGAVLPAALPAVLPAVL